MTSIIPMQCKTHRRFQLLCTLSTYPSNDESRIFRWPRTRVQPLKFRMLLWLTKSSGKTHTVKQHHINNTAHRVVIPKRPFPRRSGFLTFFHSWIHGNGNGQFPHKTGMLLQCEFQYDITQTVRLTNGSQIAACRMCHAVPSYRQAMPYALSTTHIHSPSSNCGSWGCKLWPRATGRHITHWFLSAVTQPWR